jgi:hypothetical protein
MTDTQIAWLAGLFEGEGSFYVNTIRKRGKVYRYPCAAIKMTDEDVVVRVKELFGSGTLQARQPKLLHLKQHWTWRIIGHEQVSRLYHMLSPYLGKRRLAKGREVLGLA